MFIEDVSFLMVLIAAIVAMAVSAYWYSKSGFGKSWMKEVGLTDAKKKAMQKSARKSYTIGFIAALVTAFVLAHVVRLAGATTLAEGAIVGFWVWLGFFLTTGIGQVLWEGRSNKLTQITTGYQLVQLILMAAILAAWG